MTYSISLGAGETTTIALKNLTGSGTNIVLEDAGGAALATGIAAATNVDRILQQRVTVLDDDAVDVLTGSAQLDWFFFKCLEDVVTDL